MTLREPGPTGGWRTRVLGRLKSVLLVLAVNVGILAAIDWTLVKLDILTPPFAYGLSGLGFGEPGVRRSADYGVAQVNSASNRLPVAMIGDSHSQLWFPNPLDSHEFVLERTLRAEGLPIDMISAGRGKYSPLQEYLLFKRDLRDGYKPRVLLMNFYSGNDFYDMLRPDDRPHFVRDENNAIVMRDPVWISYVNPETQSWLERSRLLWSVDELMSRLGFPRVTTRLRMLSAAGRRNRPRRETLRYLAALRKSQEPRVGYPAAFAAQILNQAIFFQHFPESTEESIAFMRSLLQRARAENPDVLLVLSAIPSAALMRAMPDDIRDPWNDTLRRTGLTEEGVAALENNLVDQLKSSSGAAGWLFIDVRDCLRGGVTAEPLYSSYDLHINAAASRRIGQCQAETLLANQSFRKLAHPPTSRQAEPERLSGSTASRAVRSS
jgi:hypothetical protein